MDFGVIGKLWEYGINNRIRTMTEKNVDGSFAEIAAAKAAEKAASKGNAAEMSFKDMWQTGFISVRKILFFTGKAYIIKEEG